MPVTAKLSRKFYETFGDEVANELAEWFNQVDATYRFEFRDLFEVHFARFDAKLEQRMAELNAKFEQRITEVNARLEQRITEVQAELRTEMRTGFAELRSELRSGLHALESKLIRWMFVFWIGQAATTVGLVFGVVKLTAR